jgi:peptidoglycan-associated lipoprotein
MGPCPDQLILEVNMKKILLVLTALALVAGCSSTPDAEQEPAAVEDRKPGATKPSTDPIKPTVIPGTPLADPSKDPRLKDPAHVLSKRSVYFDFDSDAIKAEFVPAVEAHAAFLRQYPNAKMLIQGNTDERGSREYNLALGQRRADALKKRLVLLGGQEAQIESVSLGEEKPVCTDRTEECFAKNRRADMLYAGEF